MMDWNRTNVSGRLNFQDPGAMDEDLLQAPGFIGELTDYTLGQAHSPNRTVAFLGAMAMFAHLTGRSYVDAHGTYTNINLIALGETGVGKDAPRRTNAQLADRIGATRTLCDALASGEALEELLVREAVILFQPDEAESFFGSLRGASRAAAGLNERFRRLYSASGGSFVVRSTAKLPKGAIVVNPHLTLFATGTPQAFYNVLDEQSIVNGLYGRCLIVNVADEYLMNTPTTSKLPDSVVEVASALYARECQAAENNAIDLTTVGETPEATEAFREASKSLMKYRKELSEHEQMTARALVVRMGEKIAKLAMLRAISANPIAPVVAKADVVWAVEFVSYVTQSMLYEAQFKVCDGKFDHLVKRFIRYLNQHGGTATRRELMRGLKVDFATFRRAVTALQYREEVIEEMEFGKTAIYTLKTDS